MDTGTTNYQRNCPKCGIELTYKWKQSFVTAERNKQTCYKCRPIHWQGKSHTDETKKKMSKNSRRSKPNLGKTFTQEHRDKISQSNMGNKSRTGMPHSEKTKRKIRDAQLGRIITPEHRNKISKSRKGHRVSPEVQTRITASLPRGMSHHNKRPENREKLRISYQRRLEKCHGQLAPFYNPSACQIFDEINKELGWNGLHAENGGEKRVRGWFLDYYEPTQNIVIEFDEKHHLNEQQKIKDVQKEKEIIELLGCTYYHLLPNQDWRTVISIED